MIGKKINQLATELAPVSTDLTIIGDPISGVSKKITLAQLGAIFSGAVSFYTNLAGFPATGDINVIYCAKDTQKLYLWNGTAYTEVFPSQALLDTYQLRSEKGVSNGYASLDSTGKVPISQLPSSIMEYKGTWNAATNTPTLANGTGDTGDVYICNVAGTVNFGAGPITFAVGDYTIYSGSIWQRSSGAVGTVTSVAASITGDAIGITGSPVTTSGTLALAFSGTSSQYINGAGNLTTFPTLTGYVPYTGATANVDLGTFDLTADFITGSRGSYTSSGGGNTLEISHTSGSGIALNITKGGNGEGLYINKTSGSGNAATIIGTLNATTLVKSGGTSTQFLKADGSVDSNTYLTTSAAATTYLPMVLSSTANTVDINGQQFSIYGSAGGFTSGRIIVDPVFSAIGYQNAGVFDGLKILTNGNAEFSNSGITRFFNQVRFDSTLTDGTYTYTLPGATGTIALVGGAGVGTVTSVGLSSATSGVTIGSTPITTSGTITLAIATASGSQQGLLSSTDWTTFNNKQNALTNPVTGTGTTNYLPKFTGTSTIGNSAIFDNGGNIGIGTTTTRSLSGYTFAAINGTTGGYLDVYSNSTIVGSLGAESSSFIITSQNTNGISFLTPLNTYSTKMFLSNSGNLGLGVTPSASADPAFQSRYGVFIGNDETNINNNAFFSSGWKYAQTGSFANRYYQDGYNGGHKWYNAPSGTAGNAISFTQAMTLDASGRLGIGTTTMNQFVNIRSSSTTQSLINIATSDYSRILNIGVFSSAGYVMMENAASLVLGTSGVAALTLSSTGAATFSSSVTAGGRIISGPGAFEQGGFVIPYSTASSGSRNWKVTNDEIVFGDFAIKQSTTQTGETNIHRLYIKNDGNVGIGTTNPASRLHVSGDILIPADGRLYGNSSTVTGSRSYLELYNGSTGDINLVTGFSTASIVFATQQGTERMRITSGGNVGIGVSNPLAILSVSSGGNENIEFFTGNSTLNGGGIEYINRTSGTTRPDLNLYNGSSNGSVKVYTTGSERMRITSGGAYEYRATDGIISMTAIDTSGGTANDYGSFVFNLRRGADGDQYPNALVLVQDKAEFIGSIKTGAPTNGTAQPWKLGNAVSGSISTDSYIIVSVNGTTYSIPALNGLP